MKLHTHALGLALGTLWAFAIFITGLTALWFEYGTAFVTLLSDVYVGYTATFGGAVIGALWGFIDAYICGALIAWFYNKFSKR